jgi:hypothetical protein
MATEQKPQEMDRLIAEHAPLLFEGKLAACGRRAVHWRLADGGKMLRNPEAQQ